MISLNLPDYFNYAGIGGTIGHEIMHNYDINGVQYDRHGGQSDWWSKESRAKFNKSVECIAEQYSKYKFPGTDMKVRYLLSHSEYF